MAASQRCWSRASAAHWSHRPSRSTTRRAWARSPSEWSRDTTRSSSWSASRIDGRSWAVASGFRRCRRRDRLPSSYSSPMHMRTLGSTGHEVSEVGFGAWQIGADWGAVADDDAMATLHPPADAGVTFFDTADVYGAGRSERLVGRLLRERAGEP